MDWKAALKVGGPAAIAVWGFYHLVSEYIKTSTIFKDNIFLNVILLSYILLFFVFVAWMWLRKPKAPSTVKKKIEGNDISNNEVLGSLAVSSEQVVNNKISGNKVRGDFKVGE